MRWNPFAIFFLGSWLLFGPLTFDHHSIPLLYSDLISGSIVCLIAVLHLVYNRRWENWVLCTVGTWLLFAPLIFWTTSPTVYANDTLVGLLLIVFSVAFPHEENAPGPGIPKDWSYNPSRWEHRIPIIVLGLLGFFVARAMSAYQLGHVATIWDPLFGNGTKNVLTSSVAKAFPISDAGLGAVTYLLESLSGVIGDTRRWRTMPWMVFLFFVLVVPAGVVSIVLIMLQPVVVGAWCTLCLITAMLTLITLPPAVDEVFASGQFMWEERRRGHSLWKAFWLGDRRKGIENEPTPSKRSFRQHLAEGLTGIDFTWSLFACVVVGFWIVSGHATNVSYVTGTLIITFSVLATAEPVRVVRFGNILFACALMYLSPLVNNIIAGLLVVGLSLPKGKIKERYGVWQKYII